MPDAKTNRERVVIVGKTRMGGGVCVGGMIEGTGTPLRLFPVGGFCQPPDTPFDVGDVWEMSLHKRPTHEPPHSEDHDEWDALRVGKVADLRSWILSKQQPVKGGPARLFGGRLGCTSTGKYFLTRNPPVPDWSTTFWEIPFALIHYKKDNADRYRFDEGVPFDVKYVGHRPAERRLRNRTLVRVSLARWFTTAEAEAQDQKCWLQLSGWF